MKVCSSINCQHGDEPQPLVRFAKNASGKDGVRECCKKCIRETQNEKNAISREVYRKACEVQKVQRMQG